MTPRRVVITGVGQRSPLGNTSAAILDALRTGRSGIRRAPQWDWVSDLRTRVAGLAELGDGAALTRPVRRITGRVGALAIGALDDAIRDAGLTADQVTGDDAWLCVGSTLGALADIEAMLVRLQTSKTVLGSETAGALRSMAHTAATSCALHLKFRGRLMAPSAACATGSMCIGLGYEAISAGRAEVVLAGGADESHASTAATFDALQAASTRYNDRPHETPRPFDAARDGIVCAEGAGFVVLESWERAAARGANVYAEVRGFSTMSSGTAATTPDAETIARCMRSALRDASAAPGDVAWVNAHATGTIAGDAAESAAVAEVLGPRVPVSSTKGHLGHTMAAAGAIESIVCALLLRERFVHPTLNLTEVAADCRGADHVMEARDLAAGVVVKNSFALGGLHTCLVFAPA
ncbi:MAG: beta-ketoacyl-[acyl-carrier-protein] synthase family protein [Planctomycetes bacterium]|nr:beta-ketoacyl-[acyl-carrier-protein] synthase family protein [Planctomycetota bacterium]